MRKTNKAGIGLIKSFEALRLKAYQDSVDVWTIGWGHTQGVRKGDVITEAEAEAFLIDDLFEAEMAVSSLVRSPLNDNEFAALVSFTFNLGAGNLKKSTLLKHLNAGAFDDAAGEFKKWTLAGGKKLDGLVRRRAAEKALFLTPPQHTLETRVEHVETILFAVLERLDRLEGR